MKQNKNICIHFSRAGVLATRSTVPPHNCLDPLLLCFPEQSSLLLEIYLLTKRYFHLLSYRLHYYTNYNYYNSREKKEIAGIKLLTMSYFSPVLGSGYKVE